MANYKGWFILAWASWGGAASLFPGPADPADYNRIEPPEVFIFPTPREATYGPLDLEISGTERARAGFILPSDPSPTLRAAVEDFNAELQRIAPEAQPLPMMEVGTAVPEGIVTHLLLGTVGHLPPLDELLAAAGLYITPTEPGPQGYRLAVWEEGEKRFVLLAGCDDQGAYWAAGSFAQLLRVSEDGRVRAYRANVRDWPGFQRRMTAVEAVYESNHNGLPSMKERMARVLALKYNVSCYSGDSRELNAWLRPRGFRAGTGYWTMQNIGRQASEWGVPPFSWSDERINRAWVEEYRRNAEALQPGLVIWHDCTDAGWFNRYLDRFWNERDEADRAAYPEEHPGRADAHRFNRIYQAVKAVSPDTDLYFTVPCYYDRPQDNHLPRIELFRDYLRTLGKLTPNDIVWVLEDRSPEDIAAYEHYLGGRCMNYRYPLPGEGGFWSTNFTSAREAAGYSDSYWFCVGHYEHDLMMACGAQYLWNPDVPADYDYIVRELVPQAARFLYGRAWREMAEFLVNLHLNDVLLRNSSQVEVVRVGQEKVGRAVELLRTAREKIEPALADGRVGIERLLQRMEGVQQWIGLRLAISEALDHAQQAEVLLAFGQLDKARAALEKAAGFLAGLGEEEINRHGFQEDCAQARERLAKLREALEGSGVGQGELRVLPLDGRWQFRLDLQDAGRAERWFAWEADRSGWAEIRVPGLWEQSDVPGAAPDYDGVAWYARTFRLPALWQGRKIVLHVGACDDEAWAYLNGEFVGAHLVKDHPETAWEEPFEFDVTPQVRWGRDNLLVIRVHDIHGGGGLWRSVYLRADEPDRPPPGPGAVEIQAEGVEAEAPSPQPPLEKARPRGFIEPGEWAAVLTSPDAGRSVQVTVRFVGYGDDVRNSAGRDLTEEEITWLADHGVGRLAISSFTVGGQQLVMQNRYPGFLLAFHYHWDGYEWNYHSLESAEVIRNEEVEAVQCQGRSFCANYGRFETWMRYEYEFGLRADGLGYEALTLIPEHDTGFSPARNGPPYGHSGVGSAINGLQWALGRLPSSFQIALVAPLADLPPQALMLDYASDRVVWEGPIASGGGVGAYDPVGGVYLALLVDPQVGRAAGAIRQFDAQEYPGDEVLLELTPPLTSDWPAGSRNEFKRWFAAGQAGDVEAAKAALQEVRTRLAP